MRPADNNIEKQIKNLRTQASAELDERLHQKFQQALDVENTTPAEPQPIKLNIVMHSRITKLAVAAVIITAICLFLPKHNNLNNRAQPIKRVEISKELKSSSELTTFISLNIALRRGGIQAVEEQLAEADKKTSLCSKEKLTIEQLLCELGHCDEI